MDNKTKRFTQKKSQTLNKFSAVWQQATQSDQLASCFNRKSISDNLGILNPENCKQKSKRIKAEKQHWRQLRSC